MTTLSAGRSTEIFVAVPSDMTFTPGAGGHIRFGCNTPVATAPAPRLIYAAETISIPAGSTVFLDAIDADADYFGDAKILTPDGGVVSLTNVVPEVLATASAGSTALTGAGLFAGYRCTTATGNITIYDNTAASGKVLVPTTALTVGSFPIWGAGSDWLAKVTTGVHVVLSGAAVVYVGVEAD